MDHESYTIGEFAELMKLSPRTIDFYTRRGLLHPDQLREGHGYRHYTEGDRRRVTLIKQLQARKFTLQEIRQILEANGRKDIPSPVEAMERVASDLENLRTLVQETRSAALATDQPAIRLAAAEALHRATALCTLLITLLQDMPLL